MHGFRKFFVGFLALCLLVTLLEVAAATSINLNFSSPTKIEAWLTESKIYDHIIPSALDKADTSSKQDGSDGSVSLTDAGVKQAAAQAFSPAFLQQSVNSFLDGNYAWLKGKTPTPVFTIDLNGPKQAFATTVGSLVQTHLASLPVCTPAQLSQLQLPVDPLSVTCRPATLDPKTEGTRVATSISTGDFLNKPVITANTITQTTKNGQTETYYHKVAFLPKVYRAAQWSPVVFGTIALLLSLAIIFIATPRRKGLRRVGSTFIFAGVLLLILKAVSDAAVNKLENGKVLDQTFSGQLRDPWHVLLRRMEAGLTQTDLYFGIAFLAIGLLIVLILVLTRDKGSKPVKAPAPAAPAPQPAATTPSGPQPAPRPRPAGTDVTGPQFKRKPTTAPPVSGPKKPKPPRLIQ